jgi:hypothetical protein
MPSTSQNPAASEWLKVMTEEIARKREDAARGRREQELRAAERAAAAGSSGKPAGAVEPAGSTRPRRKTAR